ncbi:MAG: ROK family protein [Bacteroidota bacterium]
MSQRDATAPEAVSQQAVSQQVVSQQDAPLLGAVETGGTKIVCGVGTTPEDVRVVATIPTTTPDEALGRVVDALAPEGVTALGIGSFGPVDLDPASPTWGHILRTTKPGWEGTDVAGRLGRALGVPAAIDTDVNAAALGEGAAGAARGIRSYVYVTIGTGIGAGVVVDGRPIRGRPHPEVGHIPTSRDPGDTFPGICPFHGDCWEGMASGPAMEARWGVRAETLPPDHPAWPIEARAIARGLATIVMMVAPRRIVLGGGVSSAPGLLPLVRTALANQLGGYVAGFDAPGFLDTYVVPPALGGRAGVAGGIELAHLGPFVG